MHNRTLSRAMLGVCEYLALHSTYDAATVVTRLLLFLAPEIGMASHPMSKVLDHFRRKYPLKPTSHQFRAALDVLADRGMVRVDLDSESIAFTHQAVDQARDDLNAARELETRVRTIWHESACVRYGSIDRELLWTCLEDFLIAWFRLNGVRTLALLDSSNASDNTSFDKVLTHAASRYALEREVDTLKSAVRDFFRDSQTNTDFAAFISRTASGAFCFLASEAPPDVAAALRSGLAPLTIYLDTNFVLSALGLNYEEQQRIATEVLSVIARNNLPFKLRYLSETERECINQITSAKMALKARTWTDAVSQAAAAHVGMNGVAHAYFVKRSQDYVTPDDFFMRFDDLRLHLKSLGIEVETTTNRDPAERFEIEHEYRDYVGQQERPRTDDAISHDGMLLSWVRARRTDVQSPLSGGALLLTLDSLLARFDHASIRDRGKRAVVVLPNQLLQLVRPFVHRSQDFDQAFSSAVLMPEFRSVPDLTAAAYNRLISLLNGIAGLEEGQAAKLLANRVVVQQVEQAKSDSEALKAIELGVLCINRDLAKEKLALEKELQRQKDAAQIEAKRNQSVMTDLQGRESEAMDEVARLKGLLAEVEERLVDAKSLAQAAAKEHQIATQKEDSVCSPEDSQTRNVRHIRPWGFGLCAGLLAGISSSWIVREFHQVPIAWKLYLAVWLIAAGIASAIIDRKRWQFWAGGLVLGGCLLVIELV